MTHTYGTAPSDFQVGQRVGIHPASHAWLAGARFGTVAKIGRRLVHVELDATNVVKPFDPVMLRAVQP